MQENKYKLWVGCILFSLLMPSIKGNTLDLKAIYSAEISIETNKALEEMAKTYSDITQLVTIGYSTSKGTEIKALKLGNGERTILINGAHHGREALTTVLVLNQIQYLADAYQKQRTIAGYDVRTVLNTVSIWFIPLVNPDGASIALSTNPNWKANGRGVDLNRNYPTPYAKIATASAPGPAGYAGKASFSEMETKALSDFCNSQQFESSIAYHSAGEVIYWWYYQKPTTYQVSLNLANKLSESTGYALVPISQSKGGLGFTDWFIQVFSKPAFTLEIGKKVNSKPLAWEEYNEIWKENRDIPFILATEVIKLNTHQWQTTIGEKMVAGQIVFGRGLVPTKAICEAMHLSYKYETKDKSICIYKGEQVLILKQGENVAEYNGELLSLPVPATIQKGEMYIPLKVVLEVFNEQNQVEPTT